MKHVLQTEQGKIEVRIAGAGKDNPTLMVLNGGHTHCDSMVANEVLFLEMGYQVVVPSRPGYGNTPPSTGRTACQAADAMVALLDVLGIERVTLMAISAAGRTALQIAGRHPERVEKLILQCALSHERWIDAKMRMIVTLLFNRYVEKYIWAMFRRTMRREPERTLCTMLRQLSKGQEQRVLLNMSQEQKELARRLLWTSRSGAGFLLDIDHKSGDLRRIQAPTLIVHSRMDGSVDFSHAEYAARQIRQAELFEVGAGSHLMWFEGEFGREIEEKLQEFCG